MPSPPPDKWCRVNTMLATAAFMRYSGYVMDWLEGMVLLAAQKPNLIPTPNYTPFHCSTRPTRSTSPLSPPPPLPPPPVQQTRDSGLQLEIRRDRGEIREEGGERERMQQQWEEIWKEIRAEAEVIRREKEEIWKETEEMRREKEEIWKLREEIRREREKIWKERKGTQIQG